MVIIQKSNLYSFFTADANDIKPTLALYSPNTNAISVITSDDAEKTPKSPAATISLSKSETNISKSNVEQDRQLLSICNVASCTNLNNLHASGPFEFFDSRTLNDLSKNQQCLHEDDLSSTKKHMITLKNTKKPTTVTVSMQNAADVSDKVF